jgi:acyl-CoA synthetase (AMP-forming)/AMP-acid ligase II
VHAFDDVDSCLAALQTLPELPSPAVALPDAALAHTAAIVFTSGTTGQPKPAMLTHAGLLLAAAVQHLRLNPPAPTRARLLCHLPINHVGCLMNLTLGALVVGGSVVFQQRFSAEQTLQLLVDERVNCWLQVPAMFHDCVAHPDFDPRALAHLHSVCIGGGAPSLRVVQALRSTGAALFVEYGQTETCSSGAYSDPGASDEVLTHCIGRFDPCFDLRIASTDGRPCADGEVGEIQARGALVFAGYFADPEATRAAFTDDGWLHTGDLAERRADGCILLRGRIKEMIKSGGYNVYPREVELVLEGHPGVAQVVVVGLPDERLGEAVHAVLTLRDPAARRSALHHSCRASLANYKVPKSFRVIDRFPLLPNGKIDRVGTRAAASRLPVLD